MTQYERLESLAEELEEFFFEEIYDLWFEKFGTKKIPVKMSIPKMLKVSRKIKSVPIQNKPDHITYKMKYFWIGE
jgi:hypothetical protein